MGDGTKIEWCDASWSPITGCGDPGRSEGCAKCYARKMATRLRGRADYPQDDPFRPGVVHPKQWDKPIGWRKPRKIFVSSMGDLFHDDVDYQDLLAVLGIIAATPRHTYFMLTKRPRNMRRRLAVIGGLSESERGSQLHEAVKHAMGYDHQKRPAVNDAPWPLPNLWLGVSCENQCCANERIPKLLHIPAVVHFISAEPLLGPIILRDDWRHGGKDSPALSWVICGAETSVSKRPMNNAWARALQHQCTEAAIPYFFKKDSRGKNKLNGRTWLQFPEAR